MKEMHALARTFGAKVMTCLYVLSYSMLFDEGGSLKIKNRDATFSLQNVHNKVASQVSRELKGGEVSLKDIANRTKGLNKRVICSITLFVKNIRI